MLNDILKATGGKLKSAMQLSDAVVSAIDSRVLNSSDMFVAIKGAHFDGHDYIGDAISKGAKAVVVSDGTRVPENVSAIEVEDTERALGDIASWWRNRFRVPCVAITGSNGKTTTKEMTAAVTGVLGNVLKTEGNFNNLIGLPLTVFRWEDSHDVAVLEMGMNAPGEIKRLTEISRPDVGLITNVTAAHLEKLHTVETVARAKGELFDAMGDKAVAIVNIEDPWIRKIVSNHKGERITFGMQNDSDIRFLNMETNGLDSMSLTLSVFGKEYRTTLSVPGTHNVMNALAAISIGVALKVDPEEAVGRLESFSPMAMRFERIQLANGVRVVNDSYNANPGSMHVAFRTVGSAKRAGRFVAALGDMLELGDFSRELHVQVGRDAVKMGVERLYAIGDFADALVEGAVEGGMNFSCARVCSSIEEIEELLRDELKAGDVLLVKGSRGMRMERVVEGLKHAIGTG